VREAQGRREQQHDVVREAGRERPEVEVRRDDHAQLVQQQPRGDPGEDHPMQPRPLHIRGYRPVTALT
jgi:hypothetical protein